MSKDPLPFQEARDFMDANFQAICLEIISWHAKGYLSEKADKLRRMANLIPKEIGDMGQRMSMAEGMVKMQAVKIAAGVGS